ncbi:MAG TPA: hypothetical protein VJ485_01500 [archaeon]|nr:hypothetical protein [archaeon]
MKISVDVSRISGSDFEKLVYLTTFAHMSRYGVIFVQPAHREMAGQKPYEIDNHSVYPDGEGRMEWEDLRRMAEPACRPVAFIKRNSSGGLDDVLYLPGPLTEKEPNVKDVTFEIEALRKEYERYKSGV